MNITLDDGSSADITIAQGETLIDVKNKINAADLDVDASIINDGTNAYLQIVSRNTGHKVGDPAGFRSRPGGDGYDVDFKDDKAARHVRRAVPGAPQRAASAS